MKEIAEDHAAADLLFLKAWRDNPETKPCCKAGCSACCSEILFVSEAETLHIIESLTPAQVEALKLKLSAWIEQTKPIMNQKQPDACTYRMLRVPCVFLNNGLCGIYEQRPFGCRSFFALENPENCEMPMRRHQKFAMWGASLHTQLNSVTLVDDYWIIDHLGILLAEKLLGIKAPSAARKQMHVSQLKPL